MELKETTKPMGIYTFEFFDEKGNIVETYMKRNLITNLFFLNVYKALNGLSSTLNITHLATGSGTTTAAKSDETLETEVFRKAVTTISYTTTSLVVKTWLAASESAFDIKEVGVFADATDTADSGVLLSRCNIDKTKNASTQLLITYTLTMS